MDYPGIIQTGQVKWIIPEGCHSFLYESLGAFGRDKEATVLQGCCRMAALGAL